ncbi:hypothetical protein K402DRAFT_411025 [Aulographum hederae CBS 113979]|uniref:PHD-type domain-containing protein n=1 Tax=Aulographum hederae CBS 113979 TaxID=1176131 RepID=A0A6G1H8P5_9PEZI|nr:hypothetical protein K402DRAFT_411025 [Aulographum hederae CBS 113979]
MPSRKRARAEMESPEEEVPAEPSTLTHIRNMWEFAALMQYMYLFGKAVKVEELDVEEFEDECLKPTPSPKLAEIGLALLKYVSSHKGLTPEIFDEYARRQYVAKAPHRNPFGIDEEPKSFNEFDVFTKICILHQLSTWTLNNADRIRDKIPLKDTEQTQWRMEPSGWDAEERAYFVLDDNRLYRRTDAPLPPEPKAKPKNKKKPKARGSRASKRRRVTRAVAESSDEEEHAEQAEEKTEEPAEEDTFGGMKWELIAITLEEYQSFLETIRKSRDPNEKALFKTITEDSLNVIKAEAEKQQQREAKRMKELENMQKLATAKRSSRLAAKSERQKEIEEAEAAERKHAEELAAAKKQQEQQAKLDQARLNPRSRRGNANSKQDRESRMMTREQRVKEREYKRILAEEEMKKLEEDSKKVDSNEARLSERHLKAEMQRKKDELAKLEEEEEEWVFDCSVCGMHGQNLDDGQQQVECEKCHVWQHLACHGIKQEDASKDDFHFLCKDCQRRAAEPIPPLKLRFSASPQVSRDAAAAGPSSNGTSAVSNVPRAIDGVYIGSQHSARPASGPGQAVGPAVNGPSLSPHGQSPGPPGSTMPHASYPSSPAQSSNGAIHANRPPSSGPSSMYPNHFGQPNRYYPQPSNYTNGTPYQSANRYQAPSSLSQPGQPSPQPSISNGHPPSSSPTIQSAHTPQSHPHTTSNSQRPANELMQNGAHTSVPTTAFTPQQNGHGGFPQLSQSTTPNPSFQPATAATQTPPSATGSNPSLTRPNTGTQPAQVQGQQFPTNNRFPDTQPQVLPGSSPGYSPIKHSSPTLQPSISHNTPGTHDRLMPPVNLSPNPRFSDRSAQIPIKAVSIAQQPPSQPPLPLQLQSPQVSAAATTQQQQQTPQHDRT